jgi:nucleoside phosphorylase
MQQREIGMRQREWTHSIISKRHLINVVIGVALGLRNRVYSIIVHYALTHHLFGAQAFSGCYWFQTPGIGSTIDGDSRLGQFYPVVFRSNQPSLRKSTIRIGMSMILTERMHGQDEIRNKDVIQALAVAGHTGAIFIHSATRYGNHSESSVQSVLTIIATRARASTDG